MPPISIRDLGGLNLITDPNEVGFGGAVDLLNVDLDKRGRIRSRDGYQSIVDSPPAQQLDRLGIYYSNAGLKHILASMPNSGAPRMYAFDETGAELDFFTGANQYLDATFVRFGGPSAETTYVATCRNRTTMSTDPVLKWNGTVYTEPAGFPPNCRILSLQSTENRLVGVTSDSWGSRVNFSGPGTPETWDTTNDYVELTPGDGEKIQAVISWRELVFVFKETKFFVFTGNSPGADGFSVFNYRPVDVGVGAIARGAAVATPNAVYFTSSRGVYRTTGGDPEIVSHVIDPIFRGQADEYYQGGVLNHEALFEVEMAYWDERVIISYPSGSSTTNDRSLVYDPDSGQWVLWNIAGSGLTSFRQHSREDLMFTYPTGDNQIGRYSPDHTTDNGTDITSRYQSGWVSLNGQGIASLPNEDTVIRGVAANGFGSPTVSIFTDYITTDALAGAITLGTDPTIGQGLHQRSYRGKMFAFKFDATDPWALNDLTINQYP